MKKETAKLSLHPAPLPLNNCLRNGLLSPALSSRGGEGEASAILQNSSLNSKAAHPGLPFGRGEGESSTVSSRRKVQGEGESWAVDSRRKVRGKNSRKDSRIQPKNQGSWHREDHQSIAHELPCQAEHCKASQTGNAAIPQIGNLRYEARGERGGKVKYSQDAAVDLLILSDGTILIHNLTPAMAAILNEINPRDETIQPRASAKRR